MKDEKRRMEGEESVLSQGKEPGAFPKRRGDFKVRFVAPPSGGWGQ